MLPYEVWCAVVAQPDEDGHWPEDHVPYGTWQQQHQVEFYVLEKGHPPPAGGGQLPVERLRWHFGYADVVARYQAWLREKYKDRIASAAGRSV